MLPLTNQKLKTTTPVLLIYDPRKNSFLLTIVNDESIEPTPLLQRSVLDFPLLVNVISADPESQKVIVNIISLEVKILRNEEFVGGKWVISLTPLWLNSELRNVNVTVTWFLSNIEGGTNFEKSLIRLCKCGSCNHKTESHKCITCTKVGFLHRFSECPRRCCVCFMFHTTKEHEEEH